jgi:hypothetical protein
VDVILEGLKKQYPTICAVEIEEASEQKKGHFDLGAPVWASLS